MPDYTRWPTGNDVQDLLDNVGVALRNPRRVLPILNDVEREVGQRTLRQFIADTQDETRTYDGSGTAELEIDEIVSLTAVFALGMNTYPGFTLENAQIVAEQNKPQTRLVVGVGSLPAFSEAAVLLPYRLVFPAGRRNIQVVGKFGYGPTIPADLWNCVAGEVAYRLLQETVYQQGGQIIDRLAGDEREKFASNHPDIIGWHTRFETAMTRTYKRPAGRRLRNMRSKMI